MAMEILFRQFEFAGSEYREYEKDCNVQRDQTCIEMPTICASKKLIVLCNKIGYGITNVI